MKFKFTAIKTLIAPLMIIAITLFFTSCKKDALKVDEEKSFTEVDFKYNPGFPYNGGWAVTLKPNDVANVVPGGDIAYVGTYKIKGKKLTVKTDNQTFEFEILSETEIKEKEYGVLMRSK